MYRQYYSYNDMPKIAKKEQPSEVIVQKPPEHKPVAEKKANPGLGNLLGKLETDDIILIVVAIILLADDCDDKLLLLALGFIFLTGLH